MTTTRRRGAAAVELALTLPILVMFLVGLVEIGRMVEVMQVLANAAREGARAAATTQMSNAEVAQVVSNYLQNASLSTSNLVVTVQDLTSPGTDAKSAGALDRMQVTVSLPFSDVRWLAAGLVTSSSTMLTTQATWLAQRDRDYPTPPEPPIE